jgi:hypothetical protein
VQPPVDEQPASLLQRTAAPVGHHHQLAGDVQGRRRQVEWSVGHLGGRRPSTRTIHEVELPLALSRTVWVGRQGPERLRYPAAYPNRTSPAPGVGDTGRGTQLPLVGAGEPNAPEYRSVKRGWPWRRRAWRANGLPDSPGKVGGDDGRLLNRIGAGARQDWTEGEDRRAGQRGDARSCPSRRRAVWARSAGTGGGKGRGWWRGANR